MTEWLVQHVGVFKNEVEGPFTIEQMRSLYNNGKLPGFKLVKGVDDSSWLPLSGTPLWDQLRSESPSSASWGPAGGRQDNVDPAKAGVPVTQPLNTESETIAKIKAFLSEPFLMAGLATLLISLWAAPTTNSFEGIAERFLFFFAVFAVLFLPYCIAKARKHPQRYSILVLTLFGWTGVLWIVALAWSLTHMESKQG